MLYGTGKLKNAGSAFARGFGAGAVSSGLRNIEDALWPEDMTRSRDFGRNPERAIKVNGTERDPKRMCGSPDPLDLVAGLGNGRGYHSGRDHGGAGNSRTGEGSRFSLGGFVKDVLTGGIVGGLGSAGFYKAGKAVEALRESFAGWRNGKNANLVIMSRNAGKGKPNAILHFDVELNKRQNNLLQQLSEFDSYVVVNKGAVNLNDLAALTAKTGDEFAMFTRGSQRMIIRGDSRRVNINKNVAQELYSAGFRWSGHTHPGTGVNVRIASEGDLYILEQFKQKRSVILDSQGKIQLFEIGG